jgi:hypothetical protein
MMDSREEASIDGLPMAVLCGIEVSPLPLVIDHWVELCCGGTLVGDLTALRAGYTIKRITIVEKDHRIRYVAKQCLAKLTSRFPTQIDFAAIREADCLPQDVTKITMEDFKRLPAVTMIFATPP